MDGKRVRGEDKERGEMCVDGERKERKEKM